MRQVLPKWWRANFLAAEFGLAVAVTIIAAWWLSVWDKNGLLNSLARWYLNWNMPRGHQIWLESLKRKAESGPPPSA